MPAGSEPTPAPPPSIPVAPGLLVVLTANLQNPYARPGRVNRPALLGRLETFARLVEHERAGIVLCQEVGRERDFRIDQWLATRLGMTVIYQRANGDAVRFNREEGLAILSRYSLSAPVTCLLGGGLWRRPVLGAVVASPLGEVAVYTAHLSLRPWRNHRQPARLRAWVEATAGARPAITGGDFNASDSSPQIAALCRAWTDAYRATHPAGEGWTHELRLFGRVFARRRLDYLFVSQGDRIFRVVKCTLSSQGNPFSDHRAVVGTFGWL